MKSRVWAGLFGVVAGTALACGSSSSGGGASGSSSSGSSGGGSSTSSGATASSSSGGSSSGSSSGGSSSGAGASSSSGTPGHDAGPPFTSTTAVTVLVTPDSTVLGQLVSAIDAATKSVHMTIYLLDNSDVINALIARKQAGVDVKVVMNQTFPAGTSNNNPTTFTTLQNAGVGVVWRNGPPNGAGTGNYTHEKTVVIDGATAWIMTMNLEGTEDTTNREYLAIDTDATDVAEADQIFDADFAGTTTSDGDPLVVSPTNSRSVLVALIDSATKTLDLEVEEFSDTYSTGITNAVVAAAKRGVATRLVVAGGTPTANQSTCISQVKAAGTKVVVTGPASGSGSTSDPYIHAKAITVDCNGTTCANGFVGSENFTGGALGYNRELGVIIGKQSELAKVQAAINTDFSNGTAQ